MYAWVHYDTWARAASPLQQGGADFMFCPRAQNTQATPLLCRALWLSGTCFWKCCNVTCPTSMNEFVTIVVHISNILKAARFLKPFKDMKKLFTLSCVFFSDIYVSNNVCMPASSPRSRCK